MPSRRFRAASRRGAALCLLTATLSACSIFDGLLEVTSVDQVLASDLETPANAELLVRSAINDFDCAFSNYTLAGGLVADEVAWGDNNSFDYERRTFTEVGGTYGTAPCSTGAGGQIGVYASLSTARFGNNRAHELLTGWSDAEVPRRAALLAETSAYEAYSILLLGEAMCSLAIDTGPELSRPAAWAAAEAKFTAAIAEAAAANDPDLANFARLGRARTRLNLGRHNDAAADAATIPAGFVRQARFAGANWRSTNQLHQWIRIESRAAVDSFYWHLSVDGTPDPRVALTHTGQTTLNGNQLVTPNKYATPSSPMPIARWAEARLIIGEARLAANDPVGAIAIIDELRDAADLPNYSGGQTVEAVRSALLEERRRELFLESHRLGDLIRLNQPFRPAAGTPFRQGGSYGTMTCFPLPDIERRNNPNLALR